MNLCNDILTLTLDYLDYTSLCNALKVFDYLNKDIFKLDQCAKLYERFNHMPNEGLQNASSYGNIRMVHYFIGMNATNWNKGLYGAAVSGNMDLINFFIILLAKARLDKGKSQSCATNWNRGLVPAKVCDNMELVNFFNDKIKNENSDEINT